MSLAQGNNTPTRPRIEPGSPDPESNALTTRPVRPPAQFVSELVEKPTTDFLMPWLISILSFIDDTTRITLVVLVPMNMRLSLSKRGFITGCNVG